MFYHPVLNELALPEDSWLNSGLQWVIRLQTMIQMLDFFKKYCIVNNHFGCLAECKQPSLFRLANARLESMLAFVQIFRCDRALTFDQCVSVIISLYS